MTVVGKILVFVNLLFSLAVGALVVMVHIVNTHGAKREADLANKLTVANANISAYQTELERQQTKSKAQVADLSGQLTKAREDLDAQYKVNQSLLAAQARGNAANIKHDAIASGSTKLVELRQEDVDQLRKTLAKETKLNNDLVKENTELKQETSSAKIERNSLLDRNKDLEAQNRQLVQTLVRERANRGGGGSGAATARGKNPPPEDVDGLIETADPSGLVTITIGSDAGLRKGNTLEVFRLGRTAAQSKYLGTIRIVEVTAHKAVGQPIGRMMAPPQRGDHVAAHILGS